MSVQFGEWRFDGEPLKPEFFAKVGTTLAPYGPDSEDSHFNGSFGVLYRAFCTTRESRREKQPHVSPSGIVITWDGRLDNRAELIRELRDVVTSESTDVAIVAAAYEHWGKQCLPRLLGDWALSVWNPSNRSLLLAKDFIGARHLYYTFDYRRICWSTILDPLVLYARGTLSLCEEYVAGWLAVYPGAHLTPYTGIHAVPPSSSVILQAGRHGVKHSIEKYWDFDPGKRIRYRTDAEYEEHFRTAFGLAVQRTLRSDRPVIADLSGGMDSSSNVCMADQILARGQAECPRLDTISWYDDSYDHLEPDTNELHWVAKVEEKRGRAGFHINPNKLAAAKHAHTQRRYEPEFDESRFAATPIPNRSLGELFEQYSAHMKSQGHRVSLCGLGGSEFLGDGVPSPQLELQDYLARLRFARLARQLDAWAARMRKPRLPLLWEAVRGFFPLAWQNVQYDVNPLAPWLQPDFVRRNRAALFGYPSRTKLFGALPSFQDNLRTLESDRMLVARYPLDPQFLREVRYPYFDRDFLEFVFAIPRDQIVRVGQRRSLMKRALVGIVPDELLTRRTKRFTPPPDAEKNASPQWPSPAEIGAQLISADLGWVDPQRLREALQKAGRNEMEGVPSSSLTVTLTVEHWLRHLAAHKVLTVPPPQKQALSHPLRAEKAPAPAQSKSLAG